MIIVGNGAFRFNIAKSNIVQVAGKKKNVLRGEYYLGLEKLKIVKAYKYLGMEFEDNLKWKLTQQRLVTKAQGKLALLNKAISEGLSLKAAENVWWTMIVPTLNYGAEISGASKFPEAEKLQLEAGRRMLRVSSKMANAVVRGELGWWSMKGQRDLKRLVYWARLVRMADNRLAKIVYRQRREQKFSAT